jgi:hypothetical protein
MSIEGPKIIQIDGKREGFPRAYFFPKQEIGGVKNSMRKPGSMIFRVGENTKISVHNDNESEVTIVSTPLEGMEKETKDIVLIFHKDNPLQGLISSGFRVSGELEEKALQEYYGKEDVRDLVCFKIPQALLRAIELSRVDLATIISPKTEGEIADYMPMFQLNATGMRAHVIQTGRSSDVTNAELHVLDEGPYLQIAQKARFFPKEEVRGSQDLILTSEPGILEKEMGDWLVGALSRSIREKFERRTGIKISKTEEIYGFEPIQVTKGFYNRDSYLRDVQEATCAWSETFRESPETL